MPQNQESENTYDTTKSQVEKKNKTWDASIIIALIAVLISSASAYISLKESRIMLDQQKMLSEQQAASVWPYLANQPVHNYKADSVVIYEYVVTNKGVGPAIIDEVIYKFGDEIIAGWDLGKSLKRKHPQLKIEQLSNAVLDGMVLAPGERHGVIKEKITRLKGDTTNLWQVLNEMNFDLEYCYCSVYGKCWKVASKGEIKPSKECKFRENIR